MRALNNDGTFNEQPNLKSAVGKLDIDNLKNVPTNLNNLKSKVDKPCVDKSVCSC